MILSGLRSVNFFFKLLIIRGVICYFVCTEIFRFREKISTGAGRIPFFRRMVSLIRPAFAKNEPFIVQLGVGGHHFLEEGKTRFIAAIEQMRDAGTLDAEFFGEAGRGETLHFEETLESVVHLNVIFSVIQM